MIAGDPESFAEDADWCENDEEELTLTAAIQQLIAGDITNGLSTH